MAKQNDSFDVIKMENGRYERDFIEFPTPIGGGAFGIVFKAKYKIDDKYYAIKKIRISSICHFCIDFLKYIQ